MFIDIRTNKYQIREKSIALQNQYTHKIEIKKSEKQI